MKIETQQKVSKSSNHLMGLIDHGRYFMTKCPKCGQLEAYIYKADVIKAQSNPSMKIHWRCNRQNNCGASGTFSLNELTGLEEQTVEIDDSTGLSNKAVERLQSLYNLNDLIKGFDFDIRGISNEVLKENKVMYWPLGFQNFIEDSDGGQSDKKYQKFIYKNRDLMFPIVDKNGNLQRLLLRKSEKDLMKRTISLTGNISMFRLSNTDKNLSKQKEVQVRVKKRPVTEIFNLKDVYDLNIKYICICEGAYDALSIKEAAKQTGLKEVGAIAIPGCRKIKKAIKDLANIPEMKGKSVVIATDNDEAGLEAQKIGLSECKKASIPSFIFDLKTYNDLNEFLQGNRVQFMLTFKNQARRWMSFH